MNEKKVAFLSTLLAAALMLSPAAGGAQLASPENIVRITATQLPSLPESPHILRLRVALSIADGWHINAHKPLDEFLIPTTISFPEASRLQLLKAEYPQPKLLKFAFSEEKLAVYEHTADIMLQLQSLTASAGPQTIQGTVRYQACNDQACLPPVEKSFSVQVNLAASPNAELAPMNPTAVIISKEKNAERNLGNLVAAQVLFSLNKAYAGSVVPAALRLNIAPGWHINAHEPEDKFLIPSRVLFSPADGVTIENLRYPRPEKIQFAFSDTPLLVYQGEVLIGFDIRLASSLPAANRVTIAGTIFYQACNEASCLAPDSLHFSGELQIASADEAITMQHQELFSESLAAAEAPYDNKIAGLIAERGLALALVAIFFGGLALNLTPCVYPLIPITISYFGGQAQDKTSRKFTLAFIYVLGIALTYSAIGVFAALSGSLFGATLQNPLAILFVSAVLVALALSMFGVWELTVPQKLNQLAGGARKGYFGALFMGLTVGIVAAPCIGPFVLALLTYVGTAGDPVLGFWLFFVLSLGLGMPYLILGTFSGSMQRLPRSGTWMIWVKKIFGVILLGMAAYFLKPILPGAAAKFLLPSVLALGGLYAGFIAAAQMKSGAFALTRKLVGLSLVAVAVWLAWPESTGANDAWQPYSESALANSVQAGKPVIIDFSADWCIACKELEKLTFPSPAVQAEAGRFTLLRADLTKFASPPVEVIKEKFNIKGLPTVVFLDAKGNELQELRVIGFIPGDEFARRMQMVQSAAGTH